MTGDQRVRLVTVEDSDGTQISDVSFPSGGFMVDPSMVTYHEGVLTVAVPCSIDVPVEACVVERWLPSTQEQVYLAIQGLSAVAVERLLIQEQMLNMGESMGVLAMRAVSRAVLGETGIPDAD